MVHFSVPAQVLSLVDRFGVETIQPGDYTVQFGVEGKKERNNKKRRRKRREKEEEEGGEERQTERERERERETERERERETEREREREREGEGSNVGIEEKNFFCSFLVSWFIHSYFICSGVQGRRRLSPCLRSSR